PTPRRSAPPRAPTRPTRSSSAAPPPPPAHSHERVGVWPRERRTSTRPNARTSTRHIPEPLPQSRPPGQQARVARTGPLRTAHAGLQVLLRDVTPAEIGKEGPPNSIAEGAFKAATKMNPAPFFTEATQKRVTLGNFADDFDKIADVDWVIEVVVERMDVKQSV